MRIGLVVLALASLAAFTAGNAQTSEVQAAQGSESAPSASTSPSTEPTAVKVVPAATAAESTPAMTVAAPDSAAGVEAVPASADPGAPQKAADSESITLKMATVPPPADFKVPAGYRAVKRGLDTVYCKSVTPIGSRMPTTYCMTREQVEQIQRQAELDRQMLKEKARTGGTSGG